MNCSTCGNCNLNLDLERETAIRICESSGNIVEKDGYCISYRSKGKRVSSDLICNFPIEKTYFGCGQ